MVEHKSAQQAVAREESELAVQERKSRQPAGAGRREEENNQQRTRCKTPGVVERKSAQQAAAREEPAVQEHESRQFAVARLNKTLEMACK